LYNLYDHAAKAMTFLMVVQGDAGVAQGSIKWFGDDTYIPCSHSGLVRQSTFIKFLEQAESLEFEITCGCWLLKFLRKMPIHTDRHSDAGFVSNA
jgi:hypothetical protein